MTNINRYSYIGVVLGMLLAAGCASGGDEAAGKANSDATNTNPTSPSTTNDRTRRPQTTLANGETCSDGRDNNHNGQVDEECVCDTPGATQDCFTGESDAQIGVGECKMGTQRCELVGQEVAKWTACTAVGPAAEICGDHKDNNCDGKVDENATSDNNCNGVDDDCDGKPDDDFVGAACDGADADLCTDGHQVCTNGAITCDDADAVIVDICDGIDNDCDGAKDEDFVAAPCDGTDADLCAEGTSACVNGAPSCSDANDVDLDTCGGGDQDCNPATADGSADPGVGIACDGTDADLCNEGVTVCVSGAIACNDANDVDLDTCGGGDQDCNPATADGSADPAVGTACDGQDTDLCKEGTIACTGGALVCSDTTGSTVDLCGGGDQDCNPATADGSADPNVGTACDGGDADLCNEGIRVCSGGTIVCNDPNDADPDLCGGGDQDCNPATPDGSADPNVGVACDGADTDRCKGGTFSCTSGTLVCSDDPASIVDNTCNNYDDDCDGSKDEDVPLGPTCDGADLDACTEGRMACVNGSMQCNDYTSTTYDSNCNGQDEDCDGVPDDGYTKHACDSTGPGGDGDMCLEGLSACVNGTETCDDATSTTTEILCNGQDDDCNPATGDTGTGTQLISSWNSTNWWQRNGRPCTNGNGCSETIPNGWTFDAAYDAGAYSQKESYVFNQSAGEGMRTVMKVLRDHATNAISRRFLTSEITITAAGPRTFTMDACQGPANQIFPTLKMYVLKNGSAVAQVPFDQVACSQQSASRKTTPAVSFNVGDKVRLVLEVTHPGGYGLADVYFATPSGGTGQITCQP